jgi:oxygen-dependent protoporphyrinogen oxidase
MNYGGLVKGALAVRKKRLKQKESSPGSRSAFLTPTTGLAEMVETLVDHLRIEGIEMRLGSAVQSVDRRNGQYWLELSHGESLAAGGLVLATPAYGAGQLLDSLDRDLAIDLMDIPYVSTATISMAFRQEELPRPLDGYGYVIPRREGRKALACTWTSTKFPHRAPEGYALLRVFVGRAGQENNLPQDEEALRALALEELRLTLGVQGDPIFTRVYYWDRAMPQYNVGHPARLDRIDSAVARLPGIALAGNGYRGIGIPDCIRSGQLAAEKVIEHLG